MRILLLTKHGDYQLVETPILPRIGDQVDRFYRPCPVVTGVILWPAPDLLKGINHGHIDALVMID